MLRCIPAQYAVWLARVCILLYGAAILAPVAALATSSQAIISTCSATFIESPAASVQTTQSVSEYLPPIAGKHLDNGIHYGAQTCCEAACGQALPPALDSACLGFLPDNDNHRFHSEMKGVSPGLQYKPPITSQRL